MKHVGQNKESMARLRRLQTLVIAFSWVMALQLVLHGVLMLLPAGGSGGLGVICSVNSPRQAPDAGNASGQLPPCCTSENCCCMPGMVPLPSAPTIPRMAAPVHAPLRPTPTLAHARANGWQWQARAPPFSV